MKDYSNALVEVDTILGHLNKEEFLKIPPIVINAIRQNKNSKYEFYFDNNVELKNQNMLPETKAILFNLFRDYLSTPEQKEKIISMQNKDRIKTEERKRQEYQKQTNYDIDSLFDRHNSLKNENMVDEKTSQYKMVIYKENFFSRIIQKLKRIFFRR